MKFWNRILSCLLLISMLLTMLPVDGLNVVSADNTVVQGQSGTIGGGGNSNVKGGALKSNKQYRPTFRVSIVRDSDMYNDGSPETKKQMINNFKYRHPKVDSYFESIFFVPYKLDSHNNRPIPPKNKMGLALYNASAQHMTWSTSELTKKLMVYLGAPASNGSNLNKVKKAILNGGYGTQEKPITDLKGGKWESYLNSISDAEAQAVWDYVLGISGTDYNIDSRLEELISPHLKGVNDLQELDFAKKQDIAIGYTGVLMSLYKIAKKQGLERQMGNFHSAIEEYISNENIIEKPVSIVIDTAIPMIFYNLSSSGVVYLNVPSMDYLAYTALIPEESLIYRDRDVARTFVQKNVGTIGNTKKQIFQGAADSLAKYPLEETNMKNGKVYRVADHININEGTPYQINLQHDPFGWAAAAPGWSNHKLSVGRGYPTLEVKLKDPVVAGYLENLIFFKDGSTDIRGFIIAGVHITEEELKISYSVDNSLKQMSAIPCDPISMPLEANQLTFEVKADSSTISVLNSRLLGGNKDIELDISGKIFRERYINGELDEKKKEIPEMSRELSQIRKDSKMIEFLQGSPQIIVDSSVLSEQFERTPRGNATVTYKYYIEGLKVKLAKTTEYEYKWEDIVANEKGIQLNYAEHVMAPYIMTGEPVPDIEIPKPSSTTDLSIENPKINIVESTLINRYDFSTGGESYAEIKSNTPGSEKWEVMAGIPSTEEIYFSAGGHEFKLAVILQYWMNETGVDRTYRSHYSGTSCEFKEGDQAKDYTVPSPTGATSSNLTVNGHKGGKVYAEWSYTVKNTSVHSGLQGYNAGKAGSPCAGNGFDPGNPGDITWTDEWTADVYNDAVQNAKDWQQAVNDFIVSYTSASDKETREWHEWNASLTGNIWGDSISTTEWASYTKTMGQYGKGSGYDAGCGHSGCTIEWDVPPVPPDKDGKGGSPGVPHVHKHSCGSFTPATETTVTKTGDKSFRIRVEATLPAHVVCGPCCEHELPAIEDTWKQGIVFDYVKISQLRLYKIDQASVTGLTELTGAEEIFANIKSGDPTYFQNIAQLNAKANPIRPDSPNVSDILGHRNTIFSGRNRDKSQSSKFGRLRYSVEPQQHDVVVWDEGVRSNKCDGLGKTKSVNVKPAGGNGHVDQFWATGTLYTNGTYANDYNHHMPRPGVSNKSDYSDRADDIDKNTIEWKKFDERRRTKNVATVISDFLILQTSGGDQSIFYFAKDTEATETQEHFQKLKATEKEMLTDNPDSIFIAAPVDCSGGRGEGNSKVKVTETFINIGGYNGHYKEIKNKHLPYNIDSDKFLTVNGEKVTTVLDNDPAGTVKRPKRTGKFMLYEDHIQIKPTAINKVYTPINSTVFYKQVLGYYSTDSDRLDVFGKQVGPLVNVGIGIEAGKQAQSNFTQWGDLVGLTQDTRYSKDIKDTINSVVVYTPVSTEKATILPLKDIDVNGKPVSRDQRVGNVSVDLNDEINKFKICPLDPALCEFRHLNCQYSKDTLLADFDFEPTYTVTEKQNINGSMQDVTVTKNNTYQSGGKWITTNKVTGIEYVLPEGFTIGNSGIVGSGKYLNAFGTRWSIPFSDIGLTSDKSNRVSVKMDFYMNSNVSHKSMLVSFWGYDFWLNPNNGTAFGLFNTGVGFEGKKGAAVVKGNGFNRKINVELEFGFNNVFDCKAKIDGVSAPVTVRKTETVWDTVGGIRKLVDKIVEVKDFENLPENITKDYIGNTINIGSWGRNNAYPANFYIDNYQIWLKGGDFLSPDDIAKGIKHKHNSSCYTTVKIHETSKIHVHDENCYVKEDMYTTCDGKLNANYQLRDDFVGGTLSEVKNFSYTGSVQTFIAPATGKYTLEVWGAQGGNGYGGKGGYSKGTVTLNKGEVLRIYVGGQGGYNGGGYSNRSEGYGGGATDIRVGGTSLYNRLIVAGGGGGSGHRNYSSGAGKGGDGGGNTGLIGADRCGTPGEGGTQSSGGSGGKNAYSGSFGYGGTSGGSTGNGRAGGGGGWYGGGGGGNDAPTYDDYDDSGGGGGSGYVLTPSSYKPSGYKLGIKYYLKNTSMLSGNRSGNGYAKISYNITKTPQGTSGLDYPNGDYTKPTKHKHTTACGLVKKGTLQCTGELNTESDFNHHRHTSECLTTAVSLPAVSFNYTGDVQVYAVPADGYYTIKAWGAAGGGADSQQVGSHKGYGGYTEGKIYLKKGERLYIYVGSQGRLSTALNTGGGWNGGGNGGPNGFGGGGATDIRISKGTNWNDIISLNDRIMVAGGGGGGADNLGGTLGGSDDGSGGNGGNLKGQNARLNGSLVTGTIPAGNNTATTNNGGGRGQGGSQVGGYRFGIGESVTRTTDTGGGGGGYWGGTVTNHNNGGGAGGSSFISGYNGCNAVDFDGNHSGQSKHYSGKIFTNSIMKQGENNGNGRVQIIPDNPPTTNILDKIIKDDYTESQVREYLGDTLTDMILGLSNRVLHTWSNWTTSNMKGFTKVGSNTLTVSNGNLLVKNGDTGIDATVEVDIDAKALQEVRITLDNPTNATHGSVGYGKGTPVKDLAFFKLKANTKNQTVVAKIPASWDNRKLTTLSFDFMSTTQLNKITTIKKIELVGNGVKVAGTGEASGSTKVLYNKGELVKQFNYLGSSQYITLKPGKYTLEVWGAEGGTSGYGGKGGYAKGDLKLTTNTSFYVYVGGKTGYNGGGSGHNLNTDSGGGATDIRKGGASLYKRIIVAGGGGGYGGSTSRKGGDGGGSVGGSGLGGGSGSTLRQGGKGGSSISGGAGGSGVSDGGSGSFGYGGSQNTGTTSSSGGGGGGGWYGGGAGGNDYPNYNDRDDGGGGGGSGYVGNLINKTMSSGVNSGNGLAKITAAEKIIESTYTFTKLKITYSNPYLSAKSVILANVDKIPETLSNGKVNPIFLCKGIPYNEHVCTSNCKTIVMLTCTEPHHVGEHYDGSNRICWEPCGNDDNHKIVPEEVEINPGEFVRNARFLQLDHEFTVYFPNIGDFKGNGVLGLSKPQSQTGYGYSNNMDTTDWTREKRVRFPFNVIHKGKMYIAGDWIELEVTEEYFDFYLVLANREASNASVEFEVEAINNGVAKQGALNYRSALNTTYANALKTFKGSLQPKFIKAMSDGYKTNQVSGSTQGYSAYFTWKHKQEKDLLSKAIKEMKTMIWKDFNGGSRLEDTHRLRVTSSINERAKPITANDNKKRMSNVLRSSSLESLHGGYKYFYLDVVGRIGNFAIVDTEDYRFSNFFKLPKTDPPEWLVEGFIYKVEEAVQNNYLGDQWDIRGNKINAHTKWLNTYGTQTWMQGTPESSRNVNNPNIITQILTADVNNIQQLKKEQLRFGYDIYTSINTIGNYQNGRVLVTPYYYALNLETGDIIPIDVYISKDGVYLPVNIFNNSENGKSKEEVYKYTLNLDWTTESDRRNYLGQEVTETIRVAEAYKNDIYDVESDSGNAELPTDNYLGTEQYPIPKGMYNYLGDSQSMLLNLSHRTFIGSEESNGNAIENRKWGRNKNPDDLIQTVKFSESAQRWHFKVGVPSSSVFVRHGYEPTKDNIDAIMNNDKYAILSTLSIISMGSIWNIEYTQPWINTINVNGKNYNIRDANIPPIIAVFSSEKSSIQDVGIIKTH